MGSFDLRCPASGLSIASGQRVVLVLVARGARKQFTPVAPPLRGRYDAFGRAEHLVTGPTVRNLFAGFKTLARRGELRVDGETSSDSALAVGGLDAFLSDVRQGQVDRTWVKAMGRDLGFVLVLAPIFDAVASESRAGVRAGSATLASTLGDDPLAALLVADDAPSRAAIEVLARFRAAFERRGGSWKPEPVGDQRDDHDRLAVAEKSAARHDRRPRLLEAIRAESARLLAARDIALSAEVREALADLADRPARAVTMKTQLAALGLGAGSALRRELRATLADELDRKLTAAEAAGFTNVQSVYDWARATPRKGF